MGLRVVDQIGEDIKSARPILRIVSRLEDVLPELGEAAGISFAVGEDAAAVEAASAAGAAACTTGLLPVLLTIIGVLLLARSIEDALLWVGDRITIFGIGSAIKKLVHWIFQPLDTIFDATGAVAHDLIITMLHSWLNVIRWSLDQLEPQRATRNEAAQNTAISHLWQHIQAINHTDALQSNEIGALQHALANPNAPPSPTIIQNTTNVAAPVTYNVSQTVSVPQQVWQELHALQQVSHNQAEAIRHLYTSMEALQAREAQNEGAIAQLSQQLRGVRAVAVGWQDVQEEVNKLYSTVSDEFVNLTAHVQGTEALVGTLTPLALLLEPGAEGLRTLRKLEDNPCLCPRFGSIPNELGTALAVAQVVFDGI